MWRIVVVLSSSLFLSLSMLNHRSFAFVFQQQQRRSRLFRSSSSSSTSLSNKAARLVFLGTPECAATTLETLINHSVKVDENSPFEVVGVVTQPARRRNRKKPPEPSPVAATAEKCGIDCILTPESAKDTQFLDELEALKPDLCITAAYGQYLPKRFLATPNLGTLNIHPSLLPKWRGASPVQRSLEAGDAITGCTVLYTVSKMDAGPIVSQTEYPLEGHEQATELLPKLFDVGTADLLKVLPNVIDGSITFQNSHQQEEEQVTHAKMIHTNEGILRVWEETAQQCHNKVRGFSIWPGTVLYISIKDDHDDKDDDDSTTASEQPIKLKVNKSRVVTTTTTNKLENDVSNCIELGREKGAGLMVQCFDGSVLELLEITPHQKKRMDAKSFVNGLRGKTGSKSIQWVQVDTETI